MNCTVGQYCSVTYPGVPGAPVQYSCNAAPGGCGGVASCGCIYCGPPLATTCTDHPGLGATCEFFAP